MQIYQKSDHIHIFFVDKIMILSQVSIDYLSNYEMKLFKTSQTRVIRNS